MRFPWRWVVIYGLALAVLLVLNAMPAATLDKQVQVASIAKPTPVPESTTPEPALAPAPAPEPTQSPVSQPNINKDPWIQILAGGSTPFHLILVEKERQQLQVLQYDGELRTVSEYFSATGTNSGKKEVSGDARTPEGIYFITKKFEDNKLTVFGKLALHLDYPNYFDRNTGLSGDGIYIHGTNRELKGNSTNGCITLHNEDIDEMVENLKTDATPVIIVNNRDVLKKGRAGTSGLSADKLRELLLPENIPSEKAKTDYLYVIDDGLQTVALGRFTYEQGDGVQVNGYGRAYLSLVPENVPQVAEKVWLTQPLNGLDDGHKKKAVVAARSQKTSPVAASLTYPKDEQIVQAFVEKWRKSWQTKNIATYISCYDKEFRQGNMDRAGWQSYKERLNKKYKTINVSVSDIKVNWTEEGAKVIFRQTYKSDMFSANGHKMLILTHDQKQGWGIEQEVWLN